MHQNVDSQRKEMVDSDWQELQRLLKGKTGHARTDVEGTNESWGPAWAQNRGMVSRKVSEKLRSLIPFSVNCFSRKNRLSNQGVAFRRAGEPRRMHTITLLRIFVQNRIYKGRDYKCSADSIQDGRGKMESWAVG